MYLNMAEIQRYYEDDANVMIIYMMIKNRQGEDQALSIYKTKV